MRSQVCKSITALVFVLSAGLLSAPVLGQDKPALKADAPDRYVVVPGDTLWSIAQRFLVSPYRWTDLWVLNKDELKNPHRIYPGDVLVLDRTKGQLALSDTVKLSPKVRSERTREKEIPSIPPNLIEPYLSRPLVMEADGLDRAPVVVGTESNRVLLGAGDLTYVSDLGSSTEDTWHFYRRGRALVDPETQQSLGYEAVHLGTGRVKTRGNPATIEIVAATQEIAKGDKLVAAGRAQPVAYAPRAPGKQIRGRIVSIYGGSGMASEAGRHSVVVINRGASQGVEMGHVLALYRAGSVIGARGSALNVAPVSSEAGPRTPEERVGLMFVFRVFDRVSYGLVMDVTKPVNIKDAVQTP
jgi:hypothetical protein